MAGIPIFTGAADIGAPGLASLQAQSSQILSRLDPTLYSQGAQAAQYAPSTIGAVAQGINQGVEAYQRTTQNAQVIEQNDIKLQQQREQVAQEIKDRQEQEQLMQILQQGTPEDKVGALTSGQYANTFAKNPKLEQYTVKIAAPHMNDEQSNVWLTGQSQTASRLRLQKRQEQIAEQFDKAEAGLLANADVAQILNGHKQFGGDVEALMEGVTFERAGEYKRDDNGIVRDPDTGKPIRQEIDDTKPLAYDIIDKKTGKVLFPSASPETRKEMESYIAGKSRLKKIGAYQGEELIDTFKAAKGKPTETIVAPERKSAASLISKPAQPSAPVPQPTVPTQKISTTGFSKEIQNIPLKVEDGKVSVKQSPQVASIAARALDISPEIAMKKSEQLSKVLDSSIQTSPEGKVEALKDREDFIKGSLIEEFTLNKDQYSKEYTPQKVKEHNAKVDKTLEQIRNSAKLGSWALPTVSLGELEKVSSPEDLYVLHNYERLDTRLTTLSEKLQREDQRRSNERIAKGKAAEIASQKLQKYLSSGTRQ